VNGLNQVLVCIDSVRFFEENINITQNNAEDSLLALKHVYKYRTEHSVHKIKIIKRVISGYVHVCNKVVANWIFTIYRMNNIKFTSVQHA
jgi:hypothetical protein